MNIPERGPEGSLGIYGSSLEIIPVASPDEDDILITMGKDNAPYKSYLENLATKEELKPYIQGITGSGVGPMASGGRLSKQSDYQKRYKELTSTNSLTSDERIERIAMKRNSR